ncbi:MAG: SseB family protein [Acetatifactor sp.]
MEFNRAVSNPMLIGCIELIRDADTPEHRNMFISELTRASLQVPAIIDPEPVQDETGRLMLLPESKIQFPMLSTMDGKKYYMGFTDSVEYDKWVEKNKKLPFFAMQLSDFFRLLFGKDSQGNISPALGLVVNPFGANVVIPREMLGDITMAKMGIRPPMKNKPAAEAKETE